MANVELNTRQKISPFRKIAIGTWQTAYDPSVYGTMRLRMDKAVDYIEQFRACYGKKLTLTHLVAKAAAKALSSCPEANAILRFNAIYPRKTIDISLLVLLEIDGKKDLSATKIDNIDKKSLLEVIDEVEARVAKIRARKDKELESTRQSMGMIPAIFINAFLKVLSFFLYSLNWNMQWMGVPKDTFGGVIVTSIGSIGLDIGYVPLVPYSRVPIFLAPGKISDEAVVDDGKLAIGKILNLNATFDHRIIDGSHAAEMSKVMREVLEDPAAYFDPIITSSQRIKDTPTPTSDTTLTEQES